MDFLDIILDRRRGGGASHWDDLEGKPFGDKAVVETVLFEGTDMPFVYDEEAGMSFQDEEQPTSPFGLFVIGAKYNVIFDGVLYSDLVAFEDDGAPTIGSSYLAMTDEVPFSIYTSSYWDEGIEYPILGIDIKGAKSSLDLKITQTVEEVIPIPKELLPEPLRFGEEVVETVLLDEKDILFDSFDASNNESQPSEMLQMVERFEAGQKYTVIIDGITYENVEAKENADIEVIYLGSDPSLMIQPELPFKIVIDSISTDDFNVAVVVSGASATHSIKITQTTETITPINEKYLPSLFVAKMVDKQILTSFEDIKKANSEGKAVIAVDDSGCKWDLKCLAFHETFDSEYAVFSMIDTGIEVFTEPNDILVTQLLCYTVIFFPDGSTFEALPVTFYERS